MSICPKARIAASTVLFAVVSSRASPGTLMAWLPSFSACRLSSSRRTWRRAVSTSRAPSWARARAQACPIPALAPVIKATFPVSFVVIFSLLCVYVYVFVSLGKASGHAESRPKGIGIQHVTSHDIRVRDRFDRAVGVRFLDLARYLLPLAEEFYGLAIEFFAPSALGRKPLKTQDSESLSRYLPRKVLPISPGRLVPGAYSEGSLRVAQAQPDFPTIRRSKNAPARLTRIIHTTCIQVRHA